ncbi:MAG: response regulator [Candidatus Falkowbacteria bacterium]
MKKLKVLIIEDEPMIAEMYKLQFSLDGYEVVLAKDGEEGLKAVAKEKPDLILLDIIMPNVDGYEVLRKIRANKETAQLLVCIVSNLEQIKEVKEGLSAGADYYFTKSKYTPGELLNLVNQAVASRKK